MRSGKSLGKKVLGEIIQEKGDTLIHSPIRTHSLLTHIYISAHLDTLIPLPKQSLRFICSLILSHRPIHTLDTQGECKKVFVNEF